MTASSKSPSWERPEGSFHAHFDCFSGAAGDMMLAACLNSAGEPDRLLAYIQHCIEEGMPELKGEFSISQKQVWRSETGSIAANHVTVMSKYNHQAAPVPTKAHLTERDHESYQYHEHSHGSCTEHEHSHVPENAHHNHNHSHSRDGSDDFGHGNEQNINKVNDHHQHSHSHSEFLSTHIEHKHSHSHVSENDGHSDDHDANMSTNSHGHAHYHTATNGPLRNLSQIQSLLEHAPVSYIPDWVKTNAIRAFTALAEAEALTHGAASKEEVHFHEVGAIDSIVDTVGTLMALYCLSVTTVSCGRLPLGEGTVWTAHGLLPVPAPATLRLMVDMPVCPGPPGITGELVTPTAAALLKVLTASYHSKIPGRAPSFTIRCVGIGAGTKDFSKHPNVLRVVIGDEIIVDDRRVDHWTQME